MSQADVEGRSFPGSPTGAVDFSVFPAEVGSGVGDFGGTDSDRVGDDSPSRSAELGSGIVLLGMSDSYRDVPGDRKVVPSVGSADADDLVSPPVVLGSLGESELEGRGS